jgi:hypothetical protein
MIEETTTQQRTRLAAGLLQCDGDQVQKRGRAMPRRDRHALTQDVDWLVEYEAVEQWSPQQ